MAEKISSGEKYLEGRRFYQVLIGGLQRYFFRREEEKLPEKFQFFSDRCVKCNLCVNSCPTNGISLNDSDGSFELKRQGDCWLCFRCYNFCPQNAINFGRFGADPDKFRRYKGPIKDFNISEIRK
jgi:formate hydrogenlyase subunit 6/NADH:ubiquinone oxidoreductase subunit I